MLNRWFFSPRAPSGANGGDQHDDSPVKEAEFIVLPPAASDSWRTWLMTGIRKGPFDRRRVRGAHKGLKKMLIEGTPSAEDKPQPWNDFSSAMVRQSVDEALNTLPAGHKQVVKLAYFGGMSNREIAQHVGLGEAAVRRRLREALAKVSAHVERGRAAAQRTVYAITAWFAARSISDIVRRATDNASDHVAQAAVLVACGTIAAAVLAGQAPSPAQLTQVDRGRITAPGRVPPAALPAASSPVQAVIGAGAVPVTAPPLPEIPVSVSAPVNTPVAVPAPPVTLPTLLTKLPRVPKII